MTITEKILAAHAGREKVSAGDLINAKVDLILANDITAPISIHPPATDTVIIQIAPVAHSYQRVVV